MTGQQGGGSNQHLRVGIADKAVHRLQKRLHDLLGRLHKRRYGPSPVDAVQKRRNLCPNLRPVDAHHRVPHGVEVADDSLTGRLGQLGHVQSQEKARQGLQGELDSLEEEAPKGVPVDFAHQAVDILRKLPAQSDPVKAVQEADQKLQRQVQPRAQGLPQLIPVDLGHQVIECVRQIPAQLLHLLQHPGEGEHFVQLLGNAIEPVRKIPKRNLQPGDTCQKGVQERGKRLPPGGEGGLLWLREL